MIAVRGTCHEGCRPKVLSSSPVVRRHIDLSLMYLMSAESRTHCVFRKYFTDDGYVESAMNDHETSTFHDTTNQPDPTCTTSVTNVLQPCNTATITNSYVPAHLCDRCDKSTTFTGDAPTDFQSDDDNYAIDMDTLGNRQSSNFYIPNNTTDVDPNMNCDYYNMADDGDVFHNNDDDNAYEPTGGTDDETTDDTLTCDNDNNNDNGDKNNNDNLNAVAALENSTRGKSFCGHQSIDTKHADDDTADGAAICGCNRGNKGPGPPPLPKCAPPVHRLSKRSSKSEPGPIFSLSKRVRIFPVPAASSDVFVITCFFPEHVFPTDILHLTANAINSFSNFQIFPLVVEKAVLDSKVEILLQSKSGRMVLLDPMFPSQVSCSCFHL